MNESTQATPSYNVDDEISLLDLLQVIVENLRLLILGPLAVGFAALGVSFLITPTFTAMVTFLPPQQQQSSAAAMLQSLGAVGGLGASVAGIRNPTDQYISLMGSRTVLDALVDRFELIARYQAQFRQDARNALKGVTRITTGKDGLIKVEVDDIDPKIAAEIANAYVDELFRLTGKLALTEAQQRRVFYEGQLAKAKEGLAKSETALKTTGIGASAVRTNPQSAVSSVASLMAQVTAKEVQLGAMRNYLVDGAPEFTRVQSELAALRGQLSRAERDTSGGGGGGGDYVAKFRDYKYYETLFDLMARQYEIAKIDESREGSVIQVVDAAIPPERKSKPKKGSIAVMATLATGFLLLLLIFMRQAWHNAAADAKSSIKINRLSGAIKRAFGRGS